ncbi:sugar ABC transporter permease [Clostridium sp. AF19-22AC]|uniref:carbohydrate ABC transporter permease n=1 Tax=Clostridia TaxID=186801 RepID=UPI000E50B563|nr:MULTISPECIES: sugar ABC transporter permease [Clostridia]RHR24389.1 sugar ABC transporter permease [Clostridium sp. AF19-22AC]
MQKILSNKKAIVLFMFPTMFLMAVFVVVPICMSAYYSLLDWDGIGKGTFIGFQNYIDLVADERFLNSVKNSLLYAACSLLIQLPVSLILAIIVANVRRGEKVYRTTFFIPVIISSVVIGQLWQKIFNGDYGLLNAFLSVLGIPGQDWLGQESTALAAAFIPNLWQYIGYHMLIMYAGIKSISPDINEAARIDGANKVQIAWKITIPLLKPILQVCVTFSLIGALKIFDLIYVLTGGGPFFSTEVPTIYMYKTIFDSFRYGYGSAIAIFVIIECMILTFVLRLFFRDKEKY